MKTITVYKKGGEVAMTEDIGLALSLLRNGTYTITIKQQRDGTASQHAQLWAWINATAREEGDAPKDIYRYLCRELLTTMAPVMGDLCEVVGTTADLDRAGMSAFLTTARAIILEKTGISLPQPGDKVFEQFKAKYQ